MEYKFSVSVLSFYAHLDNLLNISRIPLEEFFKKAQTPSKRILLKFLLNLNKTSKSNSK